MNVDIEQLLQSPAFGWSVALSFVTFIATLLAVPWLLVRLPADYFALERPETDRWRDSHPTIRWTAIIIKNLAGAVLVLAGLLMLVVVGPGVLTILMGLALLSFPGKRRLMRWIVSIRPVRESINAVRVRAQRPPLEL